MIRDFCLDTTFFFSGTLIISSGLLLHICVAAMLLVKPEPVQHKIVFQETKLEFPDKLKNKDVEKNNEYNKSVLTDQSVKSITHSIFSNLHFILLMLTTFKFLFGTAVVFTHIMAFAESEGISASFGNMMVSALGLFSILGRVGLSSLSQLPWISTLWLYSFAVFFCGKYILVITFEKNLSHTSVMGKLYIVSSGETGGRRKRWPAWRIKFNLVKDFGWIQGHSGYALSRPGQKFSRRVGASWRILDPSLFLSGF